MLEIYATRVHLTQRTRHITQRFHWLANNTAGANPWIVSKELNDRLVSGSFWFDFLTLLISDKAAFRRITTRRILPATACGASFIFPGGGVLGQWPFEQTETITACRVQWIAENDSYGKYATRIGPLGAGATDSDGWNPLFLVAAHNWASQHGITYSTPSGVDFTGATLDKLGIANVVVGAQIGWPPASQANRRIRY